MSNEIRTAAAKALVGDRKYRDDICVYWSGTQASHSVSIWVRDCWDSTPLQNAGFEPLDLARWLFSQGDSPTYLADLNSDGSATVYRVEFAEEADDEEGVVEGEPIGVEVLEEVDAPEEEEEEEE